MIDDGLSSYQPRWASLTDAEARDPLAAIYEVQCKIADIKDEIDKCQKELDEHQKRLEFLRGVVRDRLSEEGK